LQILSWDVGLTSVAAPSTTTKTVFGIATTVTDYSSWRSSMNDEYSVSGVPFSGPSIPVYTTIASYGNGAQVTATVYYNSEALSSAGYTISGTVTTIVSCPPTTTETLPPSPTGSLCSPHGDHCKTPATVLAPHGWSLLILYAPLRAL
jgi:hypothetical protein